MMLFLLIMLISLPISIFASLQKEEMLKDAITAGDISKARSILLSKEIDDSSYLFFAQAELFLKEENYISAKQYYALASINRYSPYASFALKRMGDLALKQDNLTEALNIYYLAAKASIYEPYTLHIIGIIDSLVSEAEALPGPIDWTIHRHRVSPEPIKPVEPREPQWRSYLKERELTGDVYDSVLSFAIEEGAVRSFLATLDTSQVTEPFPTSRIFSVAQNLASHNRHSEASQWLHAAMGRDDFDREVDEKEYLLFRTDLNFSLQNWGNVVRWGETFHRKFGNDPTILFHLARANRSLGRGDTAQQWYTRYVRAYPRTAQAHNILWYQAWVQEDAGNLDSAITLFTNIATTAPDMRHAHSSAFRVGLLHYRKGDYLEAADKFKWYMRSFPRSNLFAGGLFWTARSYSMAGDSDSAAVYYQRAIDRDPIGYYAWRSRQEWSDAPSFETYLESLAEKENVWLENLESQSQSAIDTLWDIDTDLFFKIARRAGVLGLRTEADIFLEPITIRSPRNYPVMLELANTYQATGEYHKAYRITRQLYWALPQSIRRELPPSFLTRFFPEVYRSYISDAGSRHEVDPLLIIAIMRQESMFHPTILSPVGAVGLMQIMPATGQQIARELGVNYRRSLLLTPESNIDFGAYYIRKRIDHWDGNKEKAIASYNGGAHNVQRWVNRNREILDDMTFFVEFIGYSETRDYVKKVLENLWTYEALLKYRPQS